MQKSSSAHEVLLVGNFHPLFLPLLEERFVVHRLWEAQSPEAREALLKDCGPRITGLVTSGNPVYGAPRSLLEHLPSLRVISVQGTGYDPVDVAYAADNGIAVTNTPALPAMGVGELALGLMLSLARHIVAGDYYARQGRWAQQGPHPLGFSLEGKVCGIAGMGQCGRNVARAAHAMGMHVHYYNRSPLAAGTLPMPAVAHATLTELAEASRFLVICVAGGPSTQHMVNADILRALGSTSYLVNVSRGNVVDEQALIAALEAGQIAGAGLDVFEREPHVPQALCDCPNTVLTPHLGSATVETREAMVRLTVENLIAFYDGGPVPNRVV